MSLGKFCSLQDFVAQSTSTEQARQPSVDDYRAPFLQQACQRHADRPISCWVSYWRCSVQISAARAMAACAALVRKTAAADSRQLCDEIEQAFAELAACNDGGVDSSLVKKIKQLYGRSAAAMVSAVVGTGVAKLDDATARVALNWTSRARRMSFAGLTPPVSADGLYALDRREQDCDVVVDVPACGFMVLPMVEGDAQSQASGADPKHEQVPLVVEEQQHLVLRTEFFEAWIGCDTGALAALYDFASRGNRLSQRLVSVSPKVESVQMVADRVCIEQTSSVIGRIRSEGRLVSASGDTLACYAQTFSAHRGGRRLEVDLQLTEVRQLSARPWSDYVGLRTAWPHDFTSVWRCVNEMFSVTDAARFESPLVVELEDGDRRTSLLTGGLPYHRRSGERSLDTLLCVDVETERRFQYAVGVNLPVPLMEAVARISQVPLVPCDTCPAEDARSGWLFHVNAKQVVASDWRPVFGDASDVPVGVRFMLSELSGREGTVSIRAFRSISEASKIDIDGNKRAECKVVDGTIRVGLSANEWTEVEARW
jgi:alpha-mannosidase